MTPFADIAGVILAGGEARRMGGVPKALCEVGGVAIVDRILAVMRPLFSDLVIVANDPAPYRGRPGVAVVPDVFKGCGPIGGIHAGLRAITRPGAFVVAGDMPFLSPKPIVRVCEAARAGAFEIAVPCSERGFEPLHAYYARSVAPLFEDAILRGRYKIRRAVADCRMAYVPFCADELDVFRNINSPGDLTPTACSAASSALSCARRSRRRSGRRRAG